MKVTFGKAITDALNEEMRRDSKVVLYGEDIAEFGNIFGLTRGMLEEYGPKRVRNTPITETAIIGSAIGAAETGLRPCVELMYSDFTTVCFAEIFHCVAKWRYMHGPEYKLPLVIRNASGSANGAGSEHSNCVESLFMHAPGLTVVTPSCAYDAKGLLKSAIRSDNPVLFCEPKLLYQSKQEIPDEIYHSDYTIPLGQADVKRQGKDVTLVAVGLMVPRAMEAAQKLAEELKNMPVHIKAKSGAGGRLFGSVTAKEIAEEMQRQHKVEIQKNKIVLEETIKNFGTYQVKVKLYPEVVGTVKVVVEEQN